MYTATGADGIHSSTYLVTVTISAGGGYLICGARGDDLSNTDDGSAYLYELNGGSYTFVNKFGEPAANAFYGASVAISPDGSTMCISAPLWSDTGAGLTSVGTAYIYE